jgi:uncharacterized membrane protein YfcA
MDGWSWVLLWLAALLGGTINSVAGGGTFFTFPSLVMAGVPPVNATATSNTALFFGTSASALAYRRKLSERRSLVVTLAVVSLVGSAAGAILLVTLPAQTFTQAVPVLMLVSSLVFTLAGRVQAIAPLPYETTHVSLVVVGLLHLPIAMYGGYFGGGQGFMMLALFKAARVGDIHSINAFKSVLAAIHNGVSVLVFCLAGTVVWPVALFMTTGAAVGGYAGARAAQRLNPVHVRRLVLVVAWAATGWFSWQAYG